MWERRSSRQRDADNRSGERLKERRRQQQRRLYVLLGVLVVVLSGAFIWLAWQPYVRVTHIEVKNDDQYLRDIARAVLERPGMYIVPNDSIFFLPLHDIRQKILDARADIAAVSVERTSLTSIAIESHERVALGRWCGLLKSEDVPEYCYLFDANGFIFTAAERASTTVPLNTFTLYGPLKDTTEEPLRASIAHTEALPALFEFAREVGELGSFADSLTITGDEVSVHLGSGTRIMYVLGSEKRAFDDLISASKNLNLSDGSLEYVDLRFPSKVYLKRTGEKEASPA